MRVFILSIAGFLVLAVAGCGGGGDLSPSSTTAGSTGTTTSVAKVGKPKVEVPKGPSPTTLEVIDLKKGSGVAAKSRDELTVQFVGVSYETGKEFEATWDLGKTFSFKLGTGEVITGWERGVEGMKVGGRRELIIPPGLAFGKAGSPPTIGPNETLVFVVDLLALK